MKSDKETISGLGASFSAKNARQDVSAAYEPFAAVIDTPPHIAETLMRTHKALAAIVSAQPEIGGAECNRIVPAKMIDVARPLPHGPLYPVMEYTLPRGMGTIVMRVGEQSTAISFELNKPLPTNAFESRKDDSSVILHSDFSRRGMEEPDFPMDRLHGPFAKNPSSFTVRVCNFGDNSNQALEGFIKQAASQIDGVSRPSTRHGLGPPAS